MSNVVEVRGVSKHFGDFPALRDVSFEIAPGSIVGLIGPNGAGKTTFLRAIMGALAAQSGQAMFGHQDLLKIQPHKRAHMGIGFMPEDRRLVPALTVEENILVPVWATGMEDWQDRLDWIYGLMPEVAEFRNRGSLELSGGQQKFVAFARALMVGTHLLLLDEPSEGIAPVFAQRMGEIMKSLKDEGESVLVAESNDKHVAGLLDRTFVIERGSIVSD